jgi:hypothetical protein
MNAHLHQLQQQQQQQQRYLYGRQAGIHHTLEQRRRGYPGTQQADDGGGSMFVGTVVGAAFGGAVAGPVGVLVGGFLGGLLSRRR